MNLLKFKNKEEAVKQLANNIIHDLNTAIEHFGTARILLSGGGTPGPVYELLNIQYNNFSQTEFGLVDERFVSTENEHSNELLIRKLIPSATKMNGMVKNDRDYNDNLNIVRFNYQNFTERTDVVLLGMGPDGHTASLFPGDLASDEILNDSSVNIFNTMAPEEPKKRITCSKKMLLNAKNIYLLIFGEEKLKVLMETDRNLPIHKFIAEEPMIKIYYA